MVDLHAASRPNDGVLLHAESVTVVDRAGNHCTRLRWRQTVDSNLGDGNSDSQHDDAIGMTPRQQRLLHRSPETVNAESATHLRVQSAVCAEESGEARQPIGITLCQTLTLGMK